MSFERRQPHVLYRKFYTCVIGQGVVCLAFFIKTTKTHSSNVTVASINTSINLADELGNLQISVNNEHFVNAVTMGKVSYVDKIRMQTLREELYDGCIVTLHASPTRVHSLRHVQPMNVDVHRPTCKLRQTTIELPHVTDKTCSRISSDTVTCRS